MMLEFFYSKFMRTECLNSRYVYDRPFPVSRLVSAVGNSILSSIALCVIEVFTLLLALDHGVGAPCHR